jgi:hypothetical protein
MSQSSRTQMRTPMSSLGSKKIKRARRQVFSIPLSRQDPQINSLVQWDVVLLNNKNYTIKNCGHASYANREPHPQPGETVFGGDRPQPWRIREMKIKGQYMYVSHFLFLLTIKLKQCSIFPTDARVYWGLTDGEIDSPVSNFSLFPAYD